MAIYKSGNDLYSHKFDSVLRIFYKWGFFRDNDYKNSFPTFCFPYLNSLSFVWAKATLNNINSGIFREKQKNFYYNLARRGVIVIRNKLVGEAGYRMQSLVIYLNPPSHHWPLLPLLRSLGSQSNHKNPPDQQENASSINIDGTGKQKIFLWIMGFLGHGDQLGYVQQSS